MCVICIVHWYSNDLDELTHCLDIKHISYINIHTSSAKNTTLEPAGGANNQMTKIKLQTPCQIPYRQEPFIFWSLKSCLNMRFDPLHQYHQHICSVPVICTMLYHFWSLQVVNFFQEAVGFVCWASCALLIDASIFQTVWASCFSLSPPSPKRPKFVKAFSAVNQI